MGTRTYSRRGADGIRRPTKLGISTGKFTVPIDESSIGGAVLPENIEKILTDLRSPETRFLEGNYTERDKKLYRQKQIAQEIQQLSPEERQQLFDAIMNGDDAEAKANLIMVAGRVNDLFPPPPTIMFQGQERDVSELVSFIRDAEQYLKFPQFITDFSTFSADEQQRLYNAVMFSNDKVAKSFMAEAMIMAGKTGQMREEAVEALLNDDIFNPARTSLYEISSLEYALHPHHSGYLTDEEKIGRLYFMHALRGYIPAVAMFQRAMEFVGPNAESANPAVEFDASIGSSPLSFNGGEMPEPNWKLVKLLQQQYEKTQEEFARRGITEVELYRGSIYEPGLPLEPWSPIRMVAAIFADGVKWRADFSGSPSPIVRKAKIPVKYFLGTWDTVPNWPEESVLGKKEYMIAGKAFADEGSWEIIDDINEWQNWMKDGTVYY